MKAVTSRDEGTSTRVLGHCGGIDVVVFEGIRSAEA